MRSIDELVSAVNDSFEALHRSKMNKNFLMHQKVVEMGILLHGENNNIIPLMSKTRLEKLGQLPVSITVTEDL